MREERPLRPSSAFLLTGPPPLRSLSAHEPLHMSCGGLLKEHFPHLLTILFALGESSISACAFTGTGTIAGSIVLVFY